MRSTKMPLNLPYRRPRSSDIRVMPLVERGMIRGAETHILEIFYQGRNIGTFHYALATIFNHGEEKWSIRFNLFANDYLSPRLERKLISTALQRASVLHEDILRGDSPVLVFCESTPRQRKQLERWGVFWRKITLKDALKVLSSPNAKKDICEIQRAWVAKPAAHSEAITRIAQAASEIIKNHGGATNLFPNLFRSNFNNKERGIATWPNLDISELAKLPAVLASFFEKDPLVGICIWEIADTASVFHEKGDKKIIFSSSANVADLINFPQWGLSLIDLKLRGRAKQGWNGLVYTAETRIGEKIRAKRWKLIPTQIIIEVEHNSYRRSHQSYAPYLL